MSYAIKQAALEAAAGAAAAGAGSRKRARGANGAGAGASDSDDGAAPASVILERTSPGAWALGGLLPWVAVLWAAWIAVQLRTREMR